MVSNVHSLSLTGSWDSGILWHSWRPKDVKNLVIAFFFKFMNMMVFRGVQYSAQVCFTFPSAFCSKLPFYALNYHFPQLKKKIFWFLCVSLWQIHTGWNWCCIKVKSEFNERLNDVSNRKTIRQISQFTSWQIVVKCTQESLNILNISLHFVRNDMFIFIGCNGFRSCGYNGLGISSQILS